MQRSSRQEPENVRSRVPHIVPAEELTGEDEEETALLRQMLEEAKRYALSFSWCDSIISSYFGGGVGKIMAVFLFNISTRRAEWAEQIESRLRLLNELAKPFFG